MTYTTCQEPQWLPLDIAAKEWGYTTEGLRRRLRQLRTWGYVEDTGRPPHAYGLPPHLQSKRIVLLWPNSQTVLIRSDAPRDLLNSSKGRRRSLAPMAVADA